MTLYKNEIIVAIEQVVEQQIKASGITAEPHRLDGEKIVDAIMEQLEGFVLVSKDQFDSLCMFKDLYKRAIINARKRKDQLNWAHVAGLGVGSGRAVELCKMLNIDPSATNMHEVIQAQEQSHE